MTLQGRVFCLGAALALIAAVAYRVSTVGFKPGTLLFIGIACVFVVAGVRFKGAAHGTA